MEQNFDNIKQFMYGMNDVFKKLLLFPLPVMFWWLAAALSLVGLFSEQDTLVRAGQVLPIS